MNCKVVKSTVKGQITIPKNWRDKFNTDNYLLEMQKGQIVLKPILIEEIANEEVIFDAGRDNDGKGVSVTQMIKMLKDIKNG
jgi:AbrB family looped-hinge helix DNA binding protein